VLNLWPLANDESRFSEGMQRLKPLALMALYGRAESPVPRIVSSGPREQTHAATLSTGVKTMVAMGAQHFKVQPRLYAQASNP